MSEDNRAQQVSLGCGTLILIALIVMFFSQPGVKEVQHEVQGLRQEMVVLRTSVEAQTEEIRLLREKLEERDE